VNRRKKQGIARECSEEHRKEKERKGFMEVTPSVISTDRDRLISFVIAEKANPTGDYIPHSKIAEVTGCEYGTHRYRYIVASSIKVLRRESHLLLLSVPGRGYRLANSIDTVNSVHNGLKKTQRGMRKLNQEAACANGNELKVSERTELNALRSIVGVIRMFVSKEGIDKVTAIAGGKGREISAGNLARLFASEKKSS
jgi:hypothetical protein